jgi:glutamyl-tRNA reductase
MDLLLLGSSHRTAGVDVRAGLAAASAGVWDRVRQAETRSVSELVVLATCHRVEIAAVVADLLTAEHQLRQAMLGTSASGGRPERALYVRTGQAAVHHLCRVACGLDSLIVGEAEVSGQLRRAAARGREAGSVGPFLDRILAGALRAGGRARSETRIGEGVLSAATAAVAILERAWGSIEGRSVLVIGAGDAGRQALARLSRRRAGTLCVASRSVRHATDAAAKASATVVDPRGIEGALAAADGVIAATQASSFLVDGAMCRRAIARRPYRSLHIVDLSVPRVVDPAVSGATGITLHTVDDLGDVVRESLSRRVREIPQVERVAADEAARAYGQFLARRDRTRSAVA